MHPSYLTERLWMRFFIYLNLVVLISIPIDMIYGTTGAMGRALNSSVLLSIVFLGTLFGLLKCLRSPNERKFLIATGLFALYSIGVSFYGETNPVLTTAALLSLFGGIAAGLGAYALEKSQADTLRHTTKWLMIGALPILFLPHLVTVTADRFDSWMNELYAFSNVRALGHYAAIAIAATIGAGHAIFTKKAAPILGPVAHFPLLAMFWLILFWSGSRAGVLSLVIAFVITALIMWRTGIKELVYNLAACSAGAILSLLYFVPGSSYGLLNRINKTAQGVSGGDVEKVTSNRTDLWTWVFERILEKPWTGWGYITMAEIKVPELHYYHAHNIVLEYWLSFGFIVGTAALALGIWLYVYAARAARQDDDPLALGALLMITLLPIYSLFSAVLINPYQLICFSIAIGALIGRKVLRESQKKV